MGKAKMTESFINYQTILGLQLNQFFTKNKFYGFLGYAQIYLYFTYFPAHLKAGWQDGYNCCVPDLDENGVPHGWNIQKYTPDM